MTAQLARALLVEAARTLPRLPQRDPPAALPALEAIDDFVAAPSPSRWLRATRLLRDLRRGVRSDENVRALADRSFARGLERVRALPALNAEAGELLAALPVDARSGRRLEALAALVAAHQELAARVREADASRRALALPTDAAEPRTRRAGERRRRR